MNTIVKYVILVLGFLLLQCNNVYSPNLSEGKTSKLELIRQTGTLRVVTDYNSTSYFIYRGQPMGYQYEMLQELANYLHVKLEVTANNNLPEKFDMLENGEIDLIAVNLTVTKERKKLVDFTEPIMETRQVLVQRKASVADHQELQQNISASQLDLANKTIYVQKNSSYAKRLRSLSDEIGSEINIIEVEEGVEQLIEMVSKGEIDYTVSDENVATVNSNFFENIDISLPVSFPQNLAWAVNKADSDLKDVINDWLSTFKNTRKYSLIYNKYYKNKRSSAIIESDYFAINSGVISPFDDYIKEYSEEIGWDWRLVTSIVYQESRFNPTARSWAGAFGLMQLMPNTAQRFGVDTTASSQMQIKAGLEFIQWLEKQFSDVPDTFERQKFVLAAYNVGPGHVMDAQRLAEKEGKNPKIWTDNVDGYLLKKSIAQYYKDPVVKYGYCRGTETYRYVNEVIERYEHYRNLVN